VAKLIICEQRIIRSLIIDSAVQLRQASLQHARSLPLAIQTTDRTGYESTANDDLTRLELPQQFGEMAAQCFTHRRLFA
jgi:hypothetical protein